ncbi:hypothetical protein [Micrococcoides hystricis]|uniref:DUF2178 domain-containing protein n=1 Tax=Micrococcoides hystricis TaxID=1572761 RepID=A0ABV6P7Y7_9MICC
MKTWSKARRLVFVGGVTGLVGAMLGWLFHVADPTRPLWLAILVFSAVIILGVAPTLYMVLWPSPKIQRGQREAEHSIERVWITEASSSAFFWLAAGLILCLALGDILSIDWLRQLTIIHVLVVAALAFIVNYALVRRESAG